MTIDQELTAMSQTVSRETFWLSTRALVWRTESFRSLLCLKDFKKKLTKKFFLLKFSYLYPIMVVFGDVDKLWVFFGQGGEVSG